MIHWVRVERPGLLNFLPHSLESLLVGDSHFADTVDDLADEVAR